MSRIIVSPSKYIQGAGELKNICSHIGGLGDSFFIISSPSGLKRFQKTVEQSFEGSGKKLYFEGFNRECTKKEIERLKGIAAECGANVIVGIGGGKTLDTAKCVAEASRFPVAIVPTIASTDAPTSACSVIYNEDGTVDGAVYFRKNPDIVLVDSEVVVNAPVRLLVSGMGDALATYFEARACMRANTLNCSKGNCSKAAMAIAELCYETLLSDGFMAKCAAQSHVCTKAVENIIEANTYLSGIGFESGGLAAAHAVHNGLTAIPETHNFYHGEKVAFGTIVQLVMEGAPEEELFEVIDFCKRVGLPSSLADLGIDPADDRLKMAAKLAVKEDETIHNMPFKVTDEMVYTAIIAADAISKSLE